MLELHKSNKFIQDYKRMQRRGYDMKLLRDIINTLRIPNKLPRVNKDHSLTGSLREFRECHIQNDWLLMYYQTAIGLHLMRTGTHSDLFGR